LRTQESSADQDYYIGRLEPPYDSAGQAKIGHMLDQYGIPFFYNQPVLICENGRRTIWWPDFTLPTYNSLVLEYDSACHGAFDTNSRHTRSDVYRLNGIAAFVPRTVRSGTAAMAAATLRPAGAELPSASGLSAGWLRLTPALRQRARQLMSSQLSCSIRDLSSGLVPMTF